MRLEKKITIARSLFIFFILLGVLRKNLAPLGLLRKIYGLLFDVTAKFGLLKHGFILLANLSNKITLNNEERNK